VRVSVVIPTRNRAKLLARAVEGVVSQSHRDVELIVVDDGSSAQQAALNARVAQAAAGSKYIPVASTDPLGSGPSRTRNIGIEASTGDLLAFCDDDDAWCDPAYLEAAVAAFAGQPTLDVFFGNQEAVAFGATKYSTWQPKLESAVIMRRVQAGSTAGVSKAECLLSPGDFAHMNTCVFRRTLLDAIGGFDVDTRYCEDLDLFVRAVDRARAIAYLRRTVAIHSVPDRNKRDNASTLLDARAKAVTLHRIATRLNALCDSIEATSYSRRLGAQACKDLARQAAASSRGAEAITWARLAGAWQRTSRWTIYTLLLRLRYALGSA